LLHQKTAKAAVHVRQYRKLGSFHLDSVLRNTLQGLVISADVMQSPQ
jgi:hypothetical protein